MAGHFCEVELVCPVVSDCIPDSIQGDYRLPEPGTYINYNGMLACPVQYNIRLYYHITPAREYMNSIRPDITLYCHCYIIIYTIMSLTRVFHTMYICFSVSLETLKC